MRDATGDTRHCRIPCAAGSGQRATSSVREALSSAPSAQHGTDAKHKMQHTTIRPVPQHAPNTNGTDTTQQAMQCIRDETNEIRTLAHLGARCASGGGVGLNAGLGLPESDVTVESCNSQNWAFGYGGADCAKSDILGDTC